MFLWGARGTCCCCSFIFFLEEAFLRNFHTNSLSGNSLMYKHPEKKREQHADIAFILLFFPSWCETVENINIKWEVLTLVRQLCAGIFSLWDYSGGKPSPTCLIAIQNASRIKKLMHLKCIQAILCNTAVDGFSCTVMWFHDYILSIKLNKFIT